MNDFKNKKILIFSDTHLTCKFNQKKFQALKKIIEKADIIIINGDFWEYLGCKFDKFIESEWGEKLFPLLKEKETHFIYGNHDSKKFVHWDGLRKFATTGEKDLVFKSGDKKFQVEHGDLISWEFNQSHRFITFIISKTLPFMYGFLTNLEYKNNIFGKTLRWYMDRKRRKEEGLFREFSLKNKSKNVLRIFGHVHRKKHNFEDGFMILGEFKNGLKNYIFIENGEVKFFSGGY